MGLSKTVRSHAGLPLSYHRVTQLDICVGEANSVWVRSYLDAQARAEEMAGEAVYSEDTRYTSDGEGPETVGEAYAWLKGRSPYEGAKDA